MRGAELNELIAFAAVSEERSFRRAAARLGYMPSTVSHTVRDLEQRLGVRLLNRTTRSVSPTEAGEKLFATLAPALEAILGAVVNLGDSLGRPSGTVRLSVPRVAAVMALAPAFARIAKKYPEITLEASVNDGFIDIVAERFDAGIRLGESVGRDMIAIPVTHPLRSAVVGSPAYFAAHSPPKSPRDLLHHRCIGYRQIASGALYRWEFEREQEILTLAVDGSLVLDDVDLIVRATLEGVGLAHAIESMVLEHLRTGALVRVLEDWCPSFPGFFLYYPSRRHVSGALRAVIDELRGTSACD
jgi:DNA-binding transcriptional LysR family regulator